MASPDFLPPDFWSSGLTQPSIPFNDNALRLWITQTNVDNSTTAQPASPVAGDTYIIQSTHTGTQWSTFTPNDVAIYDGATWHAFAPNEGMNVSINGAFFIYNGSAWVAASAGTGSGDVVGPSGATADAIALFDSTTGKLIKDSGETIAAIRRIPQNSQSTAYTFVLADAGKHILHPSADTTSRTFTIPPNSSVAYPIGTAITIINQNAAGVLTISITTDTLRLAIAGTTGNRALAANGIATAIKLTSTEWIISGSGLS